jgi:hypothetical protein
MAFQTVNLMPTWYNRPLVSGVKINRISVAPSIERKTMEYEDQFFSLNTAGVGYGRQTVRASRCSV